MSLVRNQEWHCARAFRRGYRREILSLRTWDAGNTPKPFGPAQRRRAPVWIEPVQERAFVIAHHHGLESSLEPHQRLGRVRTAVDQIANPEKAVGNGIKAKFGQGAIQRYDGGTIWRSKLYAGTFASDWTLQQIVASLARWLANLARIGWKWMRHKMTPPATSACLDAFLAEFARGIQIADSKRPRKTTGKGTTYQEGIGPFTENETVKLVLNEFPKDWKGCKLEPLVPFPSSPRRKCDLRIVAPSGKLYIEIKMMRLLGDNGKTNDNIAMHILSPYPQQRSALTDIQKLKESGFDGDKAIVIYGYDYDEYPLSLMMDYFETLAGHRLRPRARPRSTGWFTPFIDEARSTAGCLLEPRRASRRASRSTDRPHVGIDTRRDLLERHLHRLLRKMGIPARRLRLVVTEHIAEHRQAHAERERLRGADRATDPVSDSGPHRSRQEVSTHPLRPGSRLATSTRGRSQLSGHQFGSAAISRLITRPRGIEHGWRAIAPLRS